MRNLSIVSRITSTLPTSSGVPSISCIDIDEHATLSVTEAYIGDEVQVTIWRTCNDGQVKPNYSSQPVATFTSPISSDPASSASHTQTVSLHIQADSRILCAIMAGGDIVTIPLDDELPGVEVVGSVESGIRSASWSPDDAFLILINGEDNLIQMTRDFDVIYESPLRTAEFGEDKQNALGWGSKSTQFHGSLGKSAASAPAGPPLSAIGSSPDDDGLPRISWRGDASFFCVSSLEPSPDAPQRRVVRVYSSTPSLTLHSTAEPVAGLEHSLAWNSSGSLIASTQRFGAQPTGLGAGREGRHDIIFFERNGLRRGGFEIASGTHSQTTQWNYKIRSVAWSSDGSILAVWIRANDAGDIVQLWTIGNYHWYLKQSIPAPAKGHFVDLRWHPEETGRLYLTTADELIDYLLTWDVCASFTTPPNDSGIVAVVDGASLKLTPFRHQNIPPPMSSYQIPLSSTSPTTLPFSSAPVHIAFSSILDILAVLYGDDEGTVELWDLSSSQAAGTSKITSPVRSWHGIFSDPTTRLIGRQIVVWATPPAIGGTDGPDESAKNTFGLAVLAALAPSSDTDGRGKDVISTVSIDSSGHVEKDLIPLRSSGTGRLITSNVAGSKVFWQDYAGELFEVSSVDNELQPLDQRFPGLCFRAQHISPSPKDQAGFFVGLSQSGSLFLSRSNEEPIATAVSSFTITPTYLVYTTTTHEAHFILLSQLEGPPAGFSEETRRVERGSTIIVAVPSTMSLVLQMPRGNLETICPRPFVLEVIKADIARSRYRRAFLACRKHHIDLNMLIDHDPVNFTANLETFVTQIPEVDYLNLFLAGVGRSSQSSDKIAIICDAIRAHLQNKDLIKYANSIMTAHVVKTPADLESALRLLETLKEHDPDSVEDAVKYIIFLVDANTLYDTALGMYNFALVLLIAQHSQRDPREYIPFLRELRALPESYQHFRIDHHLKRHPKALLGLHGAGPDHFTEALEYVETHRLYLDGIKVWRHDPAELAQMYELYANYLVERREFFQAANAFRLAQNWQKALLAYEKAHTWQEVFTIATDKLKYDNTELESLAARIFDDLHSRKRFYDAAQVLINYSNNIEHAAMALVQGNFVSDAFHLVVQKSRPELIEMIIHPESSQLIDDIIEEIDEAHIQLSKQSSRLEELAILKKQSPDTFFQLETQLFQDVDMMTDAGDSVATTAFTRYTKAPSASSSRQTSKSRKKQDRKRGRKGTIHEEEYILTSITKLVTQLAHFQGECTKLLSNMLNLPLDYWTEAQALQAKLETFETELVRVVGVVWPDNKEPEESVDIQQLIDRPKKPVILSSHWKVALFDAILY